MVPDHEASSVCSNSSNNNDDVASNRSCSPAGSRLEAPGTLPPNFKRVISGEEGRSCVRTDVIFVHPEKPKKEPTCRETPVSKESPSKAEVYRKMHLDCFFFFAPLWNHHRLSISELKYSSYRCFV